MAEFTIEQIVAKYVQIRDEMAEIAKRHAAELQPLNQKLQVLNAVLLDRLNKSGVESARTDAGTAYKKVVMSATVEKEGGWEQILDFIMMKGLDRVSEVMARNGTPEEAMVAWRTTPELSLLCHAVSKEAIKEYMDNKSGEIPPGVKVSHVTNVGVRRE